MTIMIIGFLGPFVLVFVPLAGIFAAPLSGVLTIVIVIHALRLGTQRRMASTIFCIGVLLVNFAAVFVACKIWIAFGND